MDIMDKIRRRQQALSASPSKPPRHAPSMLYIGCVDARLDPIDDIGIEKGTALIFRNIGALVCKDEQGSELPEAYQDARIPQNVSIGAVLEFFIKHFPPEPGGRKHIVISGHTDCGGLKACLLGRYDKEERYLPLYLESLKDVRETVMQEARAKSWSDTQILHALEKESVRRSLDNLLTYPAVRLAIEKGTLEVHGWVIDTATQRICEMNSRSREFEPMTAK